MPPPGLEACHLVLVEEHVLVRGLLVRELLVRTRRSRLEGTLPCNFFEAKRVLALVLVKVRGKVPVHPLLEVRLLLGWRNWLFLLYLLLLVGGGVQYAQR